MARPVPDFPFPALAQAAAAAFTLLAAPAVAQSQPADPCAAPNGFPTRIESVGDHGDLRLSDGQLARLADLDLGVDAVSAAAWPQHVAAIRRLLAGLAVRAEAGGDLPDRWGRRPLRVSLAGEGGESLHRRLIANGLARVAPLGEQEACAASLLPLEAAARAQSLGLWREPAARLLDAREPRAIQAFSGRFAIVEGTVLSVGDRPRRVYLNFGLDFRRDFSATLSRRAARLLEKAGIAPSSLRGRSVRIRGMVSGRRAPAIEIAGPGQVEVVK